MRNDLRFALRMIYTHPWFSAAVVATLAMGIGVNTMVFTLVNAVLFKPVPLPNGERLVVVLNRNVTQDGRGVNVSYPDFRDLRANASSLEGLEAAATLGVSISEQGNPPQQFNMARVSPGMFEMLRLRPVLGRAFLPDDGKPGAAPVVLLGYSVWKDRYGGAPDVVGRTVRVNSKPATVIGVMPERLKFPQNEDLWMAIIPDADSDNRASRNLQLFGLMKPGTAMSQASTDLNAVAQRLAASHSDTNKNIGILVQTFHQRYNGGPVRIVFLLMLASVAFVLLIACANVANMMLGRALVRQREISIRAAMGASRWQIIRQLLIESFVLTLLGGSLGMALSVFGVRGFDLATQDVGKPYWIQFQMDYMVFFYFTQLCIFSSLVFGLAPALRASRVNLHSTLKDGTRSAGSQSGGRLSAVLVVFQFALTLVLLTGAGVFLHSVVKNMSLNRLVPGDQILSAFVRLPRERYADAPARLRFFDQLLQHAAALPGVTHVALASNLPGLGSERRKVQVEGAPVPGTAAAPNTAVVHQTPGYLGLINLPVLIGRDFQQTDGSAGQQVTIVSKQFAERSWPNDTATGKRLRFYTKDKPGDWYTVVGVTANITQRLDDPDADPVLFLPYRQDANDAVSLVVRTDRDPNLLGGSIRTLVSGMDHDLPVFNVRTLSGAVAQQQQMLRLLVTLFTVFAIMALVIASVGIYAVIAQATASRTREIGVRMALGATSRSILGMVMTRGSKQLLAGLVLGLAAAYPAARVMRGIPLSVSPMDPAVFIVVSLMLVAIGLFACWLPARKAAALNPVNAIRYE